MTLHQTLEAYAHGNSLTGTDTRIKMAISLIGLGATLSSDSPLPPLAVFVMITLLTVWKARIPWKAFAAALSSALSFAIPASAAIIYVNNGLSLTGPGNEAALLAIARVLGGSASLFFLAFTTPSSSIFGELLKLGVPRLFVELSLLTYRYIFILIEEAWSMKRALTLRQGFTGYIKAASSLGLLVSTLFVRSLLRGQRIQYAMEARGYYGLYPEYQGQERGDG